MCAIDLNFFALHIILSVFCLFFTVWEPLHVGRAGKLSPGSLLDRAKPSACSVGWWLMAGAGLF
jgi:hypothetical protein